MQQTLRQVFEKLCVALPVQDTSIHAKDVGATRLVLLGPSALLMGARHVLWIFALIPACFHPSYDHPRCGPNGECPSELTCSAQSICEAGASATDDAGINPMIDGPPDALVCYGAGIVKVCFASPPTQPVLIVDQTLDTGDPAMCAAPVTGGDNYCVVVATTITISGTLRAIGTKPLVLIGSDSITIVGSGWIDVGSRRARPAGVPELGAGADANATLCVAGLPATSRGGGAGGSFTGTGGTGGNGAIANTGTVGAAAILPIITLRGGCPGQDGQASNGSSGHGGGAVYLIAGTKIDIGGIGINAGGEGGGGGAAAASGGAGGGGGGGAGGMIGLDAPTVMLTGSATLVANGGGGGEGGSAVGTGGADGTDATIPGQATGGKGATSTGGDGGNGSAGAAAGAGGQGASGTNFQGTNGGGGGGGGGAGLIKGPVAMLGGNVSPAATP